MLLNKFGDIFSENYDCLENICICWNLVNTTIKIWFKADGPRPCS